MTNPSAPDPREQQDDARVFIVEDHTTLRELLAIYCRMQDGLTLCGEAESAEEALDFLHKWEGEPPAVGLIDHSLPGKSGIELIKEILRVYPEMKCLVLSAHKDVALSKQALEAGACGYVLKGNPDELVGSVHRALAGEQVLSPEVQALHRR